MYEFLHILVLHTPHWDCRLKILRCACVVALRVKAVWELEMPKGYHELYEWQYWLFFTLQESKGRYQNVLLSLRNADITYCCELLRMFSSFLLLNVEYHLLNIYWVPLVHWLQICPNIAVPVLGMTVQNWPELLSVVTLSWLQLPVFTIVYVTIFCVSM